MVKITSKQLKERTVAVCNSEMKDEGFAEVRQGTELPNGNKKFPQEGRCKAGKQQYVW